MVWRLLSDGNVTIAGVTSSDNSYRGISLTTIGNVILSNSRTDGNLAAGGVAINPGALAVTVNNLSSFYNNHGLYIGGMTGKLLIYNSTLAVNNGYGIYANVVNPATDVILSNVTLFGNNGAGVETDIY